MNTLGGSSQSQQGRESQPYRQLDRSQQHQEEFKSDDPPLKLKGVAIICCTDKRLSVN